MVLRDDASCAYETKEMAILARGCLIGKKKPSPCEGREGFCKASQSLTSIHAPLRMVAACNSHAGHRRKE